MKHLLLAFIVVAVFSQAASAFEIRVADQTFVAPAGGSREIVISANSAKDDTLILDLVDETPWMTLSSSRLELKAGKQGSVTLYVSPFTATSPGLYRVVFSAESALTGERELKDVFISVTRGEGVEVEKIEVSGNLEPTGSADIKIFIKNLGNVALKDINLLYWINSPSGKAAEWSEVLDFEPQQSAVAGRPYRFEAQQEAGDYIVVAELSQSGKLLDRFEQGLTIPKKAVIRQKIDERKSLFRKEYEITITNYGNDISESTAITGNVGRFESYFYAGTPPTSSEGDVYTWDVKDIKPGETRTILYAIDMTSFYLFLAGAVLICWLFFFKMRMVRIRKFIMQKKLIEEGEEFTVGLELTNKTGKTVEEAVVKDFVPAVFEIKDTEGPKPARKKTPTGTELAWKTKDLNKEEVRIFTYKIIPTFGVQGRVRLPRAQAAYGGKGRETHTISGFASIGVEAEETEDMEKKKLHHHVKKHVERLSKAVKR